MLKDQTALVTGAGRGIGRAIALRLAENGADVAVSDIMKENSDAVADEIRSLGRRSVSVVCDVANFAQCQDMMKQVKEKFGKIDILVNNAGITRDNLIMRMSEEDWDSVLNVNLKSVFNCSKAICRIMMKQKNGKIINVSSVVGIMGNAGQANYSASKAGVIGLTKTLAKEFASRGITVNAVAPGFIQTKMTEFLKDEARDALLKLIPMGRMGEPEEVADAVLFLASPLSTYITGHILPIDGGMAM